MKTLSDKINFIKIIPVALIMTLAVAVGLVVCGCTQNNSSNSNSANQNNAAEKTNFTPTDYSQASNWFMNEANVAEKANTKADVIYFNGTCVEKSSQENGVAYIGEEMQTGFAGMYDSGSSVFADGTRMFQPFYRQISTERAINCKTHEELINLMKESEVATDICAALDYYFKNYNNDRPFLIAGASQGGAAVQIALEQFFGKSENRKYLDNLVAAYSIAYGVDKNWVNDHDYIKFATGPTDTGVLVSWVTEGPGCEEKDFLLAENPSDTLAINPINWKTDDTYASASECLGTYEKGQIVTPGLYNLQLNPKRGCLICDNNTNYMNMIVDDGSVIWGGKSLHGYEISQAYLSIRQNMHDRIDKLVASKK